MAGRALIEKLHRDLQKSWEESGESSFDMLTTRLIPGWVWACDPDGRYVALTPEVEAVLGIPAGQFISRFLGAYRLSPHSADLLQETMRRGNFPARLQVDYERTDGALVPVALYILRETDPDDPATNGRPIFCGFAHQLFGIETGAQSMLSTASGGWVEDYASDGGFPSGAENNPRTDDSFAPSTGLTPSPKNTSDTINPPTVPIARPENPQDFPLDPQLASRRIRNILQRISKADPELLAAPICKVRVATRVYPVEDRSQAPQYVEGMFGRRIAHFPQINVLEIEHRLEWGLKIDLTKDEQQYLERYAYQPSGMTGMIARRFAPKSILCWDKSWVGITLEFMPGKAQNIHLAHPGANPFRSVYALSEFINNPEVFIPELIGALRRPFTAQNSLTIGIDYMKQS